MCFESKARDIQDRGVMNVQKHKQKDSQAIVTAHDVAQIFPKTVEQIEQLTDSAMHDARQELDVILALEPETRTFDNTIRALDTSHGKLSRTHAIMELLSMVSPEKSIREASHEKSIRLSQFFVDLYTEPKLYQAFKAYDSHAMNHEDLTGEERYFFTENMKEFKRSGLHLPAEKLEEVKKISKEIAQVGSDFDKNIATDNRTIAVDKDGLDGVSDHVIKYLKRKGEKYLLGCDYPTYYEVMQNCTISSTRKALYLLFQNRAYPKNIKLLEKLIAKRDELAKKLGFDSYAAFDIDAGMAKNIKTVQSFLYDLLDKAEHKTDQEFERLKKNLPDGVTLDKQGRINPWDYSYIVATYKKKNFNIDEREIAQYFPVQKTLDGIFKIYQDFLGLDFKFIKPDWVWHNDVQLIEIKARETEKLYGYLFLDLYPRENKYSHACHITLVSPQEDQKYGISIPDIAGVIANFPKATKDRPAMLKHSDVETFFHEFGHAMHGVLGRTAFSSTSGTSVKRDFVEMPSQMFEEWMSDKSMLARISGHYKTGEALPGELIEKKLSLKKFDSGYATQRQCFFALVSLSCFNTGAKKDTGKIIRDIHEKYIKHVRFEPDAHMQAAFGHLHGYGAKYYGYMWAKVFALDLFYFVKDKGLENKEIAKKFVHLVLSKGGSDEPSKLLRDFLGREPNQKAFLHDLGLM